MADAPSGGGKWETFEIVIVIILIGGILMKLTGASVTSTTTSSDTTAPKPVVQTKPTPTPHEACGLTTTSPASLAKVASSVTVAGTITGCNWVPNDDIALYAQVVDAYGKPISEYTPIQALSLQGASVPFSTTVELNSIPMTKSTGYLILVPATPTTGTSVSARIPLTLSPE